MGKLRLRDFRRLVATSIGDTGHSNEMFDIWINMGYVDVMTSYRHKNLLRIATIETVPGVEKYPLPCDLLGIDSLTVQESGIQMIRGEPRNIRRFDRVEGAWGEPRIYTRVGEEIDFWPTPNDEYTVEMWFFREAESLQDPADVTIFPSTWDPAIHYFATYHALSSLGRSNEQCALWLQRANNYIGQREDDDDFGSGDVTLPLDVITSYDELQTNRRFFAR